MSTQGKKMVLLLVLTMFFVSIVAVDSATATTYTRNRVAYKIVGTTDSGIMYAQGSGIAIYNILKSTSAINRFLNDLKDFNGDHHIGVATITHDLKAHKDSKAIYKAKGVQTVKLWFGNK